MPAPSTTDDPAFDLACHLIETQLNGRLLPTPEASTSHLQQIRQYKARLVRAVYQTQLLHFLTDAFRVVDAALPYLAENRVCTDAAVVAACGPLYGGLDHYRGSTKRAMHAEARALLTRAIARANETG